MSARKLVYTALLAALTAAGAFIRIPIGISVITLQFLFTAMAGVLLGPGGGALSQGVYVALGLVGLPIFTAGGGFGYVLQPSFGFLLGLIPAAAVIGGLSRRSSSPVRLALACGAGLAVLYAVGAGGSLCRGGALYGADPQRLSGQGHQRAGPALVGDADLSAGGRRENRRDGPAVPGAAQAHSRAAVGERAPDRAGSNLPYHAGRRIARKSFANSAISADCAGKRRRGFFILINIPS